MASNKPERLRLDALGVEKMASGHLCLNLSEAIAWDEFPKYGESLLRVLRGRKIGATESVETRIWAVAFAEGTVSLVWSDYPAMVSLESSNEEGDALLQRLYSTLQQIPVPG